ncbi:MAG: rRNA ((2552)-2-O)-methyltransferase RlmE [Pseudomonadota bacterium]|jgi:23S rRNA (uridine2552-2'-O)-methyltransferase
MSKRSSSSARWLAEHFSDEYVKLAQEKGYRSRAIFKLEELDRRHRIFHPGQRVVDLGAAPGGWSQYAVQKVGRNGQVYAMDLLDMEPIPRVDFLRGDFTDESMFTELLAGMGGEYAHVVLSDMAPNMSGNRSVDQHKAMYLAELVADMVGKVMAKEGTLVIKLFQGAGFQEYLQMLKPRFSQMHTRKPKASRDRSPEVYLVAQGYRPAAKP